MTNTPLVSIVLLAALLAPQELRAADTLECRPIATSDKALPEICTTDSYREELAAYINLGTVYQADGARWTDRIELWPDLSENQVVFGNGRTSFRMNAYLRVRDLKDLMESIRPRLNLLKASPEFSLKLKALVVQQKETKLNLSIPLRLLLDTPFTGAGAALQTPLQAARNDIETKAGPKSEETTFTTDTKALPLTPVPLVAADLNNAGANTSAVHKSDLPPASCKDQIATLIQSKEDAEEQFRGLEQALADLGSKAGMEPSGVKKQKNRSLAALAEDIAESDCDKCDQAIAFCKSKGTLSNAVRKKDGCRRVFTAKACYLSVPAPLLLPVENCRGTHPRQINQLLQSRGLELKKKISELNKALEKKDQECASEAVETS